MIFKEDWYWYLMMGFNVCLMDNDIVMQFNFLLKYVEGVFFDVDINFFFMFFEQFIVGVFYWMGGNKENSIGEFVFGFFFIWIGDKWMVGVFYDFIFFDLQDYNDGSVEFFIYYFFGGKSGKGVIYDNLCFFNSNGSNKCFYQVLRIQDLSYQSFVRIGCFLRIVVEGLLYGG